MGGAEEAAGSASRQVPHRLTTMTDLLNKSRVRGIGSGLVLIGDARVRPKRRDGCTPDAQKLRRAGG